MAKNRNYSCKDVDMLMASKTIAGSFRAHIAELSAIRSDWTEEYADGLTTRIDNGITNFLGIDSKKDLRGASAILASIQAPARRDVSFFKIQVMDDFKKDAARRDEILKNLGFAKHLRGVQKGNQESLIQLLYSFQTNMNDTIRAELVAKGMNATLIDNIISYADTFQMANVTQESFKESTKEISQSMTDAFNAIYDEISGICKKASSFYQYEPLKKEQFVFKKALVNLVMAKKKAEQIIQIPQTAA
jgi:hypothetical protein